MSRRRRSLAFLLLALLAAAGGAAIADRYGADAARGYGPLRPVVIAAQRIGAGERFGAAEVESSLVVRRVPRRFIPPGTLAAPGEAFGLVAGAELPPGSYLVRAQLAAKRKAKRRRRHLGGDRRPVEIAVSGAGALLAVPPSPAGSKVDIVVTSEPGAGGRGRAYVAAADVPLLALESGTEAPGGATATATLALTKRQALRLLAAESFARKLTLLPDG